jgi:hypothetical protein
MNIFAILMVFFRKNGSAIYVDEKNGYPQLALYAPNPKNILLYHFGIFDQKGREYTGQLLPEYKFIEIHGKTFVDCGKDPKVVYNKIKESNEKMRKQQNKID